MNKRLALFAAIAIGFATLLPTAHADTVATQQPWASAQAVLRATETDLGQNGILGVRPHVADLEQALADADKAFDAAGSGTGTIYVLTDGPTDTLAALAAAASDKNPAAAGRRTVAISNPYPLISLYLGSYYNEIGKPEEGLRALDAGLALYKAHGIYGLGAHQPLLMSERAAALTSMKRWADALAGYDEGLALTGIEDRDRARLHRGRGYALTELGRLDEAEAAYNESLKLDPNNQIALGELQYIAKLRAGGAKETGGITLPKNTP